MAFPPSCPGYQALDNGPCFIQPGIHQTGPRYQNHDGIGIGSATAFIIYPGWKLRAPAVKPTLEATVKSNKNNTASEIFANATASARFVIPGIFQPNFDREIPHKKNILSLVITLTALLTGQQRFCKRYGFFFPLSSNNNVIVSYNRSPSFVKLTFSRNYRFFGVKFPVQR